MTLPVAVTAAFALVVALFLSPFVLIYILVAPVTSDFMLAAKLPAAAALFVIAVALAPVLKAQIQRAIGL